jgi:hypothetical protein
MRVIKVYRIKCHYLCHTHFFNLMNIRFCRAFLKQRLVRPLWTWYTCISVEAGQELKRPTLTSGYKITIRFQNNAENKCSALSTSHLYQSTQKLSKFCFKLAGWQLCATRGAPKGGAATWLSPQTPQNRNLKNTDFIDIMISKVLRYFAFSQNQPLKSADDQYVRILKNKLIKFRKTRR